MQASGALTLSRNTKKCLKQYHTPVSEVVEQVSVKALFTRVAGDEFIKGYAALSSLSTSHKVLSDISRGCKIAQYT